MIEKVDGGGLGEVEAHLGAVAHAVAVGRELLGLGREADHERELALELLRDEEGGDGREHEQREHHPDDGAGHAVRKASGASVARMVRMRVQLIDPSADVLPYDHALAGALARRGLDVELVTSRFVHGPRPEPDGYELSESFYRAATRLGGGRPRLRRALKLAEHVPDTLRVRAAAAGADLVHWQWLWLEAVSARAAAARAALGADHAQRDPARALGAAAGRAHGRHDRAHPPRRRAAGRRPARARDPPRRLRAPHPPAGRAAAAARAGRGAQAGGALLRRGAPLQGRRRAGGGIPLAPRGRAVGGGAAAGRDPARG